MLCHVLVLNASCKRTLVKTAKKPAVVAGLLIWVAGFGYAQNLSPLMGRGYTVLPVPQRVVLGDRDVRFGADWRIEAAPEVANDVAVSDLRDRLAERYQLALNQSGAAPASKAGIVRLAIEPNAVSVTGATDRDKAALIEQAYKLVIESSKVSITGNSSTGLFYGVQTFLQLLKRRSGQLWLPEATIEDWPDLEMRIIYWDDAHHLEHFGDLKAAIRQASFYKINGFSIKLEGHFEYRHAPAIVDPYALSPGQLQDLTDYALRYHVQLIPYLDGPAHDAFILKHPEYSKLREYPESNYEFCVTNPDTYVVFERMFDDLLAATKGSKYFVLSTDEPYYVGLAHNAQCDEADRAKQLGSVGKLLAEFITNTANYLHARGRTVIFWGEYPLKPDDVGALPSYLINGEVYGPQFDPVFRSHGIRQMVYTFTEGEEEMFPQYYVAPAPDLLHRSSDLRNGRVQDMVDSISFTSTSDLSSTRPGPAHSNQGDLMGVFIAGWADAGLHPETFWLGYATGPAAGWNQHFTNAEELQASFFSVFYGAGADNMGRLYQLMSEGAQVWHDTWDTRASAARKPIWGDSYTIFDPPRPARDQFLPPLPVPSPQLLQLDQDWTAGNSARLSEAATWLSRNDELLGLLYQKLRDVDFNRYNIEVYLSIAALYRQNLTMIQELGQVADLLKQAEENAAQSDASKALEAIDSALDVARHIEQDRNQALANATRTWYKSWHPRVPRANGRTYLHELDDVKDHQPMRTIDMSYLVYRELLYPLGDWAARVVAVRNEYASRHGQRTRNFVLDWGNTSEIANRQNGSE
jgi:hypothetical protein